MALRQRARVTMLWWSFFAGAWFDSGYMFQRRRAVEVPLSVHRQSGGYCCYVTETSTHSVKLCKVVDNPVMAQRTFLQQTTEISQLQSIDTMFDVPAALVQQFPRVKTVRYRDPTVALVVFLLGPGRSHARCVQRQMPGWFRRRCSTFERGRCPCYAGAVPVVMDAPVTVQRRRSLEQWKCLRISSSPAMKGFFVAFCAIFRAPPVVPELSASFSSFRALTPVSARRAPGVPESPGVSLRGDMARDCANWLS